MAIVFSLFEVFLLILFFSLFSAFLTYFFLLRRFNKKLKESLKLSRAVLKGSIYEQLSPFFKDFPFKPGELKFLGKPVDFIAFVGLDENKVREVVFIEVKTSSSKLNPNQSSLKQAIKNKKVRWFEFRID